MKTTPPPANPVDPELAKLREKLQYNAEYFRSFARDKLQVELNYDLAGMRWLDGYIQRQHEHGDPANRHGILQLVGAFFGECIIRNIGGVWERYDDMLIVRFDERNGAFPFNKVGKHLENGAEAGDSVLGMYDSLLVTGGVLKPTKVVQAGAGVDYTVDDESAVHPAVKAEPQTSVSSQYLVTSMQANAQMEQIMQELRSNFARTQQVLNERSFAALRVNNPSWMSPQDGLAGITEQQFLLHKQGQVVWATLVQANQLMFSPGQDDCPAMLVYSTDAHFDARPHELRAIGHQIFELKNGKHTDPELQRVADLVTDELDRSMDWKIPSVLTAKDVRSAAFMVFRKHIPNGVLSCGQFPILIHPSTPAVMILPFEFWPLELIMLWKQRQL